MKFFKVIYGFEPSELQSQLWIAPDIPSLAKHIQDTNDKDEYQPLVYVDRKPIRARWDHIYKEFTIKEVTVESLDDIQLLHSGYNCC